jgi:hypothetical protein
MRTLIIFWLFYVAIGGIWMAVEMAMWGETFPSARDSIIGAVMAFILTRVFMEQFKK